ncbi:MAG: S8 family serine peptidase [Deltaproteobacteria bacterium]|nr:S8 family serine peptidase [Deltaproteobacteria bacterium]
MTALAWRWCASEEPAEVVLHVELAEGAALASSATSEAWGEVAGVKVVDSGPLFTRPAAELARDHDAAVARAGHALPDLSAWRRVRLRGSRDALDRALDRIRRRSDVVTAFEAPRVELPFVSSGTTASGSCPIRTPPYDDKQGYLRKAPAGIDAPFAWGRRGGRGEGVWFADIEGAWNTKHEDLPGDRVAAIGRPVPNRAWEMHGTAVLGEVVARTNDLGMVGIAPNVPRVFTSSVNDVSAATAIDLAQAQLRPGDVLLVELHAIGPRGRFMPMELWDDVFQVIQIATARGVIVVEAAGNGAEDLDHEAYRGKLDRTKRDSGAIMVGAGAPALPGWTDRSRLDFSNYGSRVDVQGWGRMVATLDYGDLQGCDATGRKYTNEFGGTSSASPIVAGAAILVESIVKTDKGCPYTPAELRSLLVATGSPQTSGPHGPATQHIGPRPDLARALARTRAVPPACGAAEGGKREEEEE